MKVGPRDFWDEQARWNAKVAILDGAAIRDPASAAEAFEAEGRASARFLAPFVHPEARVVDLGCGIGRVMRPLAALAGEVIGVDVSGEMIERGNEYMKGVPNHRFVHTDGHSLTGIEDGSVDFLFSALCFIHVDRRSAYRYFGEIARVLAPAGRAWLQFHDLESALGIAKFEGVLDSEYPLEFYTERELSFSLGRHGLSVLDLLRSEEYLLLQVVRGPAEDWERRWRSGLRLAQRVASGVYAGAPGSPGLSELTLDLELSDDAWRGFRWLQGLWRPGSPPASGRLGHAHFFLRGPGRHELRLGEEGPGAATAAWLDGRPLEVTCEGRLPAGAGLEMRAGLTPAGLTISEGLVERFRATSVTRPA